MKAKIMNRLPRRTILKSSGLALAGAGLWPLLSKHALAQSAEPPKRLIIWYVPEGAAQQAFWPGKGPGPLDINMNAAVGGNLTPKSQNKSINEYRSNEMGTFSLQPLKPYEQDLTLLSGFKVNPSPNDDEPHRKQVSAALTGSRPGEGSFDQIMGQHMKGENTPFPAIYSSVFGESVEIGIESDYASPFRTLSGNPGTPTWNPVTTFNRVFPNGLGGEQAALQSELTSHLAALGSVNSRLDAVRCLGGQEAQDRLQNYLTGIEKIESSTKDLLNLEPADLPEGVDVSVPPDWVKLSDDEKYWNLSDNFGPLVKISIDTTVAAMALDRTRVSLLTFAASGKMRGIPADHYGKVGIDGLEKAWADHEMGHNDGAGRRRDQARVFRWYYSQLAYLIERLKSVPEGDGTLYDNTLIMCCSEFGSYNHRNVDPPYMLVGNPGGAFKKGVYIDAFQGGHRGHADLFLAVAKGLGVELDHFGTSTTPYQQILA